MAGFYLLTFCSAVHTVYVFIWLLLQLSTECSIVSFYFICVQQLKKSYDSFSLYWSRCRLPVMPQHSLTVLINRWWLVLLRTDTRVGDGVGEEAWVSNDKKDERGYTKQRGQYRNFLSSMKRILEMYAFQSCKIFVSEKEWHFIKIVLDLFSS